MGLKFNPTYEDVLTTGNVVIDEPELENKFQALASCVSNVVFVAKDGEKLTVGSYIMQPRKAT